MIQPIRPEEVAANRVLPDEVMKAWNDMITEKFNGHSASITQDEIVTKISNSMDVSRQYIFDNHWLDIEDLYRAFGWKVQYNKAMIGDNFDSYFIFRKGIA